MNLSQSTRRDKRTTLQWMSSALWLLAGIECSEGDDLIISKSGSTTASVIQASQWHQYNGPRHDRTLTQQLELENWSAIKSAERWKVETNAGFSSFVVGGGKTFTVVTRRVDDVDREVCVALDIQTGQELWQAAMAEARFGGDANAGTLNNRGGDGPRSTPSYDNGRVYVLDARLGLYCFDATTGTTVWRKDIVKEHEGRLIDWGNAASPLIEGDLVFLAGGGLGQALLAFDKQLGKFAWKGQDDKMTHATPIAATIHGIRQIIFFTQPGLVSVVPDTGTVLWRQPYQFRASSAASPVVFEDIVYCSAGYGVGAGAYRVVMQPDGKLKTESIWRKRNKLMNHWSTPVCKDGFLYGMFSFKKYGEGPLKCVDIRTGDIKWSVNGFGSGNCIVVGKHVIALSDKGEVVLIEATSAEYREIHRADVLDGKCWSTPSYTDGNLYIRSTKEGACLDLSS